jgi:hypothetical protein
MAGMMVFFTKFCDVGVQPNYEFSMNPVLMPGQSRLVLTWSDKPKDLDIYVLAPHSNPAEPPCEVNWRAKACHSGTIRLDRDDTDGHGPETISILNFNPGTYVVRIDEYKAKPGSRSLCLITSALYIHAYTLFDDVAHTFRGRGNVFERLGLATPFGDLCALF